MASKIRNIEEWKNSHTIKQYMLFNITGCKDGEGEPVVQTNNPRAFNSFIREPVFSNRAYAYTVDGSDIGTTYVEVDLTNQRAYFIKDGGLLLDCDIISGLPSRGNDTPGGFYVLNGLYRDCILRGPGYASHVDYWMPFNGGIGLHDASWQSKFGGELFKTRGSHGCVNLEYQMAQTVYEYGYKYMPVICYWRNSKYMVDEKDRIDDRKQQFFGL